MNVLNCRSAPVAGSGVPVVFGMPSACLGCHQCECGAGGYSRFHFNEGSYPRSAPFSTFHEVDLFLKNHQLGRKVCPFGRLEPFWVENFNHNKGHQKGSRYIILVFAQKF